MDVKLYVGNISFSTTEDELRTLFSQAGTVKAADVIKDRESGRSKGFAFVTMSTQEEAEEAIKKFNGFSFGSRELKVNIARPKEESGRGGYGGNRNSGGGYGRNQGRNGGDNRYGGFGR
ncbi:RNA recognition motif domain-containing protein [Leptolinea tardivitalis]|nr:RNA-binding protein [Leptolinea tardivitalis]GAP21304.1 RNA-binding protein [Leptolinea tardivitalis]